MIDVSKGHAIEFRLDSATGASANDLKAFVDVCANWAARITAFMQDKEGFFPLYCSPYIPERYQLRITGELPPAVRS